MFRITARTGILLLQPLLRVTRTNQYPRQRRRSHWPIAPASEAQPPATPYTKSTPLLDLPILSLDTEATGLDPGTDRIVSIAAASLQQGQLHLAHALDLLVDPQQPIPSQVTAIHGITDAKVQGAPKFDLLAALLETRIDGHVLLGHNVYFDAAILQHEMRRIGQDWQRPPLLDTMLLYACLYPTAYDFSLDAVARRLRISLTGRHTALGDVLIALDIYHRLLPPLAGKGIITLGQAEAASAEALAHLRQLSRRK